ncbi:ephexin-1 [Brienomyrus brachyistius]|uniref:ephexin-1 n=1 Tax=Brienomyrus brachyistius TaxID=42636 RepID=UPI0020B226EE|nr:ephexin-1 [Brienomyrus brachyistius]XP_048836185.1 ephexin-1 [Brienomyrus brachyistius]
MVMAAFFRGRWGQKAQDPPDKRDSGAKQLCQEEDDGDEDPGSAEEGSGRRLMPIRRNSRFYSSMRKKRLSQETVSSEQPTENLAGSMKPTSDVAKKSRTGNQSNPGMLDGHRTAQRPTSASEYPTVLPSNQEPRSPRVLESGAAAASPAEAVLRRGLRGPDLPPRNGQRTDCAAGSHVSRSPRSDGIMESLVAPMADCLVRELGDGTCPGGLEPGGAADLDTVKLRLVKNDKPPDKWDGPRSPICHSIKIIKNIPFLYQEYRDTSEQQEIEQRRQLDTLQLGGGAGGGAVSVGVAPPTLQLQLRNDSQSLSLWQNLDVVRQSGLLSTLPQKEIIMQEAMFELVTSEASYYKSLELLETHFLKNPVLVNTLSQTDTHFLFSNIEEVMKASERFLMDLENRVEQSIQISDVCDIVYEHAVQHFHVFINYVINQGYQEKHYRRILQGNAPFRETMAKLENQPKVRGLSFTSFLILPFQRITRLKLLVQNILKKAEENSDREANAVKAHEELERIVKECNEGVRKMSRTEELISIEKMLEFKCKSVPVISHSRWLLKKGELQQMNGPKNTRTMRSRKLYQPLYLFLFNNLLLVTKKSSNGEKYQVLDSCTRAMLRTEDMEDQGQMLANVFTLNLLENQEDRQVTYLLKTSSVSEKLRWICALTPNRRTRFLSTSAHQPDSPQVQCIQSYSSQEPDELSIEMADVLNILERTDDGWILGERLHDGEKGWFPIRVVEEIKNQELRAQNLRECQRIQLAKGGAAGRSLAGSRARGPQKIVSPDWLRPHQSIQD